MSTSQSAPPTEERNDHPCQADCLCALPRRLDLENEVLDGAITPTMVRLRLDLEEGCPTCTLAIESATRNVNIHRVLSN